MIETSSSTKPSDTNPNNTILDPEDVISFWFEKAKPSEWFTKNDAFDSLIEQRFKPTLIAGEQCELHGWRLSDRGRLAEIILLDQFSRNVYRGKPKLFSNDPLALALAQEAVAQGTDKRIPDEQRKFLYMPYMHSESKSIHILAYSLFSELGDQNTLEFEQKHKNIIDQFGRYPHRNELLGRESTPEELLFLKNNGLGF